MRRFFSLCGFDKHFSALKESVKINNFQLKLDIWKMAKLTAYNSADSIK